MIEVLAIPAWKTPTVSLENWVQALSAQGLKVFVDHDPPDGVWLEVSTLGLRGYVILEQARPTAINFELHAADTAGARAAIEFGAKELGWELYDDDEAEDKDD
jgi:imidazolonepropionase-like amidohydrolase